MSDFWNEWRRCEDTFFFHLVTSSDERLIEVWLPWAAHLSPLKTAVD